MALTAGAMRRPPDGTMMISPRMRNPHFFLFVPFFGGWRDLQRRGAARRALAGLTRALFLAGRYIPRL